MKRQSDAPDPVTIPYLLALCEQVGGQRAAARLIRVSDRTLRRWTAGDFACPWCAAELLRRMAQEIEKPSPPTILIDRNTSKRAPRRNFASDKIKKSKPRIN